MTYTQAIQATFDELTDELAAACWDTSQQSRQEALADVLRLMQEYQPDGARHVKIIIDLLATAYTRDDAGRHFTEWLDWQPLEELGLIEIDRPVHVATGISYDQQYWTLHVTKSGMELLQASALRSADVE